MNKCDKKQEENSIVQNEVDEIILQDNLKLSVWVKTHENIGSEVDENDIYDIDNVNLDKKKNDVSVRLK